MLDAGRGIHPSERRCTWRAAPSAGWKPRVSGASRRGPWEGARFMRPLKVGVGGCGTIATVMHLPGLAWMREQGKVEIVAVNDAIPEKAAAASVAFGVPAHFSDLSQMLAE